MNATPLESKLEKLWTRLARENSCITFKVAPTHVGLPDRCVIGPDGHIMLVELKKDGGSLRPAQRIWIERAQAKGAPVFVVTGEAEVRTFFANVSVAEPEPDLVSVSQSFRREFIAREGGQLSLLHRMLEKEIAHAGRQPSGEVTVRVETHALAP